MTFMDSLLGLTRANPLEVELNFLTPIEKHLNTHSTSEENDVTAKQLAQLAHAAVCEKICCAD